MSVSEYPFLHLLSSLMSVEHFGPTYMELISLQKLPCHFTDNPIGLVK